MKRDGNLLKRLRRQCYDTVVYLPREKIVCTDDLMETQLAYMGDSFPKEWVAISEAIKKLDFMLVLPGHGRPFPTKARSRRFRAT